MPLDLAALEALHKAASPVPWTHGRSYESIISPNATGDRVTRDAEGYGGPLVCESLFASGDRDLVIAARNALPELIRLARIGQEHERNQVTK